MRNGGKGLRKGPKDIVGGVEWFQKEYRWAEAGQVKSTVARVDLSENKFCKNIE
jgi:hypothetical protein